MSLLPLAPRLKRRGRKKKLIGKILNPLQNQTLARTLYKTHMQSINTLPKDTNQFTSIPLVSDRSRLFQGGRRHRSGNLRMACIKFMLALQLFVFLVVSCLFSKSLQQEQPMALAVQGSIYCMSCASPKGSPLPGAVAKLVCEKFEISAAGIADQTGTFNIQPKMPLPDFFEPGYCRVLLISSPSKACQKAVVAKAQLKKGYIQVEGLAPTLHYITGALEFGPTSHCGRPK